MKRFSAPPGLPRPRNPITQAQVMGKGGVHQKSTKALRRTERQDLARLIREDCMAVDG